MNKQVKILAGCIAALLLLVGALAAALLIPKPDDAAPQEETLALAMGEITAVTVANESGAVELTKTVDGYAVKGLEGLPLSENAATLAGQAENLEAVREIAPEGGMEPFGLASPRATVTIETSEGTRTLTLGNESPTAGQSYAALDGKVYLMKNSALTAFAYGLEDYVSPLVSDPLDSESHVDKITLRRGEETLAFSYVPEVPAPEDGEKEAVPAYYRLTSPVEADVELYKVSTWANGAFGMSAQGVAAVNPGRDALAAYGLDAPETEVTLTSSAGDTLKLSVSAPREGVCYLLREGVPLIYRVSQADVGWRTATVETLTGSVFPPMEDEAVAGLEIRGQGEDYRFTRENGAVRAGGKTVTEDRFAQVIDAALRIPPEYLGETAQPSLEPALTITVSYTEEGRESDTLRLIPTGSGSLYLELNGEARFTARESYLGALLQACADALADEPAESAP